MKRALHTTIRGREKIDRIKVFNEQDWKNIVKLKLPPNETLELIPDIPEPIDEVNGLDWTPDSFDYDDWNYVRSMVKDLGLKPDGRNKDAYVQALKDYHNENF